jgi:hypothetical protein
VDHPHRLQPLLLQPLRLQASLLHLFRLTTGANLAVASRYIDWQARSLDPADSALPERVACHSQMVSLWTTYYKREETLVVSGGMLETVLSHAQGTRLERCYGTFAILACTYCHTVSARHRVFNWFVFQEALGSIKLFSVILYRASSTLQAEKTVLLIPPLNGWISRVEQKLENQWLFNFTLGSFPGRIAARIDISGMKTDMARSN